jgi:hypothetical protein
VTTVQVFGVAGVAWLTVLGLVAGTIRAIVSGALVPRSQVDALTKSWEARLNESHTRERDWMASSQAKDSILDEYAEQFGQLLISARTTEALIRALPSGRDT